MTVSAECYRRVTGLGGHCEVRSACLALRAVEGIAPIRSRVGLLTVRAWTLRACFYACGVLAVTFMLGLILAVIFARPASAAQNPVASASGTAPPGVTGQAAGGVVSSVASAASTAAASAVGGVVQGATQAVQG